MKKALCFFLAIVFVCCVITHGKNERFSIEAFLNNITNFEDMPTIQDVVDCWTLPYYEYDASEMPEWIEWCTLEDTENNGTVFVNYGWYPLAYEEDGTLTTRHDYEWHIVYNSNGTWNENPRGDPYGGKAYPIITKQWKKIYYEDYEGDNEILQFFSFIRGFFVRFWETIKLVIDIIVSIFTNLKYLLPWNSTVPKGAI